MANNRLTFEGLDQFRAALRALPQELANDAAGVVDQTTDLTATDLRQAYPRGDTGNLRAGVKVKKERSGASVIGIVRSTSPHAHLWEFGTQNRVTQAGWRRGRAPSNKPDGLVAIAQRNRKRMNQQLMEIVRQSGFQVSGDL